MSAKKRVAVVISGRGSNMRALVEAAAERDYPAEIVAVISDKAEARGLEFARRAGIEALAITRDEHADKAAHEAAVEQALTEAGAEFVCLAGYMRLLSAEFVRRWEGRLVNIHPSLLPLFKGLAPHRQALEAGVRLHGCTVHFVTPETDSGPIIAQAAVPVAAGDTEAALSERVLKAEHRLYVLALRLLAEGKVRMEGGRAVFASFAGGSDVTDAALFSPEADTGGVDIESLARFTP